MTGGTSPSPVRPGFAVACGPSRSRRFFRSAPALVLLAVSALAAACSSASSTPPQPAATRPPLNSMVPASVRATGLVVLTDPVFPPISYYPPGSTTDITGSDPQILEAMAKALGLGPPRFAAIGFEGMLTGVQAARGNVAAGGLTDTAAREQVVNFVDNFAVGELFVVKRGATVKGGPAYGVSRAPLSACGHTVAYTIGAVSQVAVPALARQCAADGKPAITPVGVDSVPATISAVLSGRAQLALYDNLGDRGFGDLNKANGGQLRAFVLTPLRGWPYTRQFWGFAVSKTAQGRQLAAALLAALKAIQADGAYQKILAKYGLSGNALNDPGLNLQGSAQG